MLKLHTCILSVDERMLKISIKTRSALLRSVSVLATRRASLRTISQSNYSINFLSNTNYSENTKTAYIASKQKIQCKHRSVFRTHCQQCCQSEVLQINVTRSLNFLEMFIILFVTFGGQFYSLLSR